jgi:hypothetical protein
MRYWASAAIAWIALSPMPHRLYADQLAAVSALRASLERNTSHARGWLEAGDFKSLEQSAGGLELLAGVLRAQSADPGWQEAVGRTASAASELRTAAQAGDSGAAADSLKRLAESQPALATLTPSGQPLPPPKANLRTLMLLMDGVRGDAKIALIVGDGEKAKNQAYVLSELGRVVSNLRSDSNSRSGERWSQLSDDFTNASLAAARSPATDPAELRPLLRAVSERCDACHETR